jgi:hypothetical protein
MNSYIHPIFLITSFILTYLIFLVLFPLFLTNVKGSIKNATKTSLLLILLGGIIAHIIGFTIPGELGNRLLHLLGGGVLASYLCYRVIVDTKVSITKFQFFSLTVLIVTALGVANEMAEFVLQESSILISTTSINDIWLDLIMNTAGTILATLILTAKVNNRKNAHGRNQKESC